jgi:hypothetical protein
MLIEASRAGPPEKLPPLDLQGAAGQTARTSVYRRWGALDVCAFILNRHGCCVTYTRFGSGKRAKPATHSGSSVSRLGPRISASRLDARVDGPSVEKHAPSSWSGWPGHY